MFLIRTGINLSFTLLNGLLPMLIPANSTKPNNTTHDYSRFIWGKDYAFESLNNGMAGYMTGIGKGVQPLDYIILQQGGKSYRYQVEEIDYYSEPSDMWIALLKRVPIA
ncbi:MAG: hypothetical protein KME32_21845 [Mojavia pulchra JT2-VF2]|jgi:MioC protein|uniref:Uncharacterized protein n=1 Tax=Mojavia pulchra JT2-VF2 TaxID=287848 RepID=A0A951Q1U4_9NOST|nr:hypothetical protein [Mojavia pulchra JT2-VF2]